MQSKSFYIIKFSFYILIFLFVFSCTKITPLSDESLNNEEDWSNINTPDSVVFFDIMTWNIEQFPKHQTTNTKVISIIDSLMPQIIALQEIRSESDFQEIISNNLHYDGMRSSSAYANLNLAFLWDTNYVKNVNIYEILTSQSYLLPRSPLVMECQVNYKDFVIINNHLKCCNDGFERRKDAVILLKNYLDNYYNNKRVILLGDLNDNLNDPDNLNVFLPFLNDRDSYIFVDEFFEVQDYSFPSYPSHIDHILISNELYSLYNSQYTEAYTIKLVETKTYYQNQVSDHLPVYLKLVFE